MLSLFTHRRAVPVGGARRRHAVPISLSLLVSLSLLAAGASAAPEPLPLADALRLAASASAAGKAAQADVAAGRQAAARAGQLPDPMLKFGIDNLPASGPDAFRPNADFMTMRRIGIEQQWVARDKRLARVERARRAVDAGDAVHLERLADVRVAAAKAWFAALHGQRAVALAQAITRAMEGDLAALEAAHRGAGAAAADVLQARAELALARDGVAAAEQDLRAALTALRRWTRTGTSAVPDTPPALAVRAPGPQAAELERRHPAVLRARRGVDLADADTAATVRDTRPDWSFELGFAQRASPYSNMVSFGVSVPLPLARAQRQDREIAEKAELGTKARLDYEEALVAARSAIETQSERLAGMQGRIVRLREALLPAAEEQVQAALAGYRGAAGSLSAVFKARRNALERRLQVNALELEAALTWAELELGLLPQDGNPAAGDAR